MASSSSSDAADPPSPPATSRPLHDFPLPPPRNRSGNPSRSNKRNRSRNSPPQRLYAASASQFRHPPQSPRRDFPPSPNRFRSLQRDFPAQWPRFFQPPPQEFPSPSPPRPSPSVTRETTAAAAAAQPRFQRNLFRESRAAAEPRFQRDMFRESRVAPPCESPVLSETKRPAIDDDFERLSFRREESRRRDRGRHWWSESSDDRSKGKVPLMAYSRNPFKRSRYSSPASSSSPRHFPQSLPKDSSPSPARVAAAFPNSSNPREALQIQNRSANEESKIQIKSRAQDENPRIPLFNKSASSSPSTKIHNPCTNEPKLERAPAAETDAAAGMKKFNDKIKLGGKEEEESRCPSKKEEEEKKDDKKGEEEKKDDKKGEEEVKIWNLRPRNKIRSRSIATAGGGGGEKKEKGEKKVKKKLSIVVSLTKQEIEEDIFAFTGAKPSRRPKRHPKNLQKLLDSSFPGTSLLAITPESYK